MPSSTGGRSQVMLLLRVPRPSTSKPNAIPDL